MAHTRSVPDFQYESQRDYWTLRKELAIATGFKFFADVEEILVSGTTSEKAAELAAETRKELENRKKVQSKRKGKRTTPAETPAAATEADAAETESGQFPETSPSPDLPRPSGAAEDVDPSESGTETESNTSSLDSDDDDIRKRTSEHDRRQVRGHSAPPTTHGKRKLFKMDPPANYVGESDSERSYDAVHVFLGQLSRYFRLATYIELDKDISEYLFSFLDGYAYRWFETLNKGEEPFSWERFESAFRKKFIPREYIQKAVKKYLEIKQGGRSVSEYIIEREKMENTLGSEIPQSLKETSFKEGLIDALKERMALFRELPFEEYKRKAESIDDDMRERQVGPYRPKAADKPAERSSQRPADNPKASSSSSKTNSQSKSNKQPSSKPKPS